MMALGMEILEGLGEEVPTEVQLMGVLFQVGLELIPQCREMMVEVDNVKEIQVHEVAVVGEVVALMVLLVAEQMVALGVVDLRVVSQIQLSFMRLVVVESVRMAIKEQADQVLEEPEMDQVLQGTAGPIQALEEERLLTSLVAGTVLMASSLSGKVTAFFLLSFCMSMRISDVKTGKYWSLGPRGKSGTIRILKSKGPMMG
jgi:hypothetical protein